MEQVTGFQEVRRDDKVIEESMTVADINRLGWEVSTIKALRWKSGQKAVEIRTEDSFLSKVVPDKQFVVVKVFATSPAYHSTLRVYRSDGVLHSEIPNVLEINGRPERGEFRWFEPARVNVTSAVGIVFEFQSSAADYKSSYQVDIDAATGVVLGTYEVR